jgi:peptidoglycan hydrolase-like protein with peptidoglycan-binding domain
MLLKRGVTGPDVVNLEQVLQGLGFQGFNSVDGIYDDKTENIIRYVQASHDLLVDGKVGSKTLALLDSLYQPFIANFAVKEETPVIPLPDGTFPKGDEELVFVHPILARKILQIIALAAQEGYNLTVVQGR